MRGDIYNAKISVLNYLRENPYDIGAVDDLTALMWQAGRDSDEGREIAEAVVRYGLSGLQKKGQEMKDFLAWRDVLGKAMLFRSHYDVDSYFQYLEWDRDLDKRFYLPRRKQLQPLIEGMQGILDDELDILTVSLPPGSGKTTSGTFFLSMVMGLFPDSYSLATAHSGVLTKSLYQGVLSLVTDPEYKWQDIFNIPLESQSSLMTQINFGEPSRFPTFTARSIDGSMTGAVRCNKLLYCDDLVSGIEEALKPERLLSLWEKYGSDVSSRKVGDCKEIHVATRWSVHDPIGKLQSHYGYNDPRIRYIEMPALNDNDESNFDYGNDAGFTTAMYHDLRARMDEVSWLSLYQQQPIEREGLLYPDSELRRFYSLPDEAPDAVIAVCDTKDKGKDYAFLPVAYVYGDDYYIADCVCDNGVSEAVEGKMVNILLEHGVQQARFESNAAGGRIADTINKQVQALGGRTHITKRFTTSNKETRIIVSANWVLNHCLFLDAQNVDPGSDYAKMLRFLTSYTQTGKNTHDDVPDGMSMLSDYANSLFRRKVEVIKSPLW